VSGACRMALSVAEDKWYRKAIAGFRDQWARMVAASSSLDAFCEGISAVTGIPAATIRSSLPAKNFADFQANASKYLPLAVAKIEAAHRAGKWKTKYLAAWGS